jgi:hypothetical protein
MFFWVRNGRVFTGTLCTVQGVSLHINNVGTAVWNTVIAGHTFWTVVLSKATPRPDHSRLLTTPVSREEIDSVRYYMRNRIWMDGMLPSP